MELGMYFTVYRTVNKLDGKVYIGKHQTNNLDDNYLGSGKRLKHAIKKHGVENFTKEILFVFNNEQEMNAKEAELVTELFCSEETNYNLCPGGQGGWGYINKNNLGVNIKYQNFDRSKIDYPSEKRAEVVRSLHKKGIYTKYDSFKDKCHTEETKRKIGLTNSIKQKGKQNSQFGTFWITNGKECKKIKQSDIIPEGWNKGRIIKN